MHERPNSLLLIFIVQQMLAFQNKHKLFPLELNFLYESILDKLV